MKMAGLIEARHLTLIEQLRNDLPAMKMAGLIEAVSTALMHMMAPTFRP